MEEKDLFQLAQKLSSRGMLEHFDGGGEALPVSLMVRSDAFRKTPSRAQRKQMLKSMFTQKLNDLIGNGLEVDFNSLSVSGQTVDAKLEVSHLPSIFNSLKQRDVDIYPNTQSYAL